MEPTLISLIGIALSEAAATARDVAIPRIRLRSYRKLARTLSAATATQTAALATFLEGRGSDRAAVYIRSADFRTVLKVMALAVERRSLDTARITFQQLLAQHLRLYFPDSPGSARAARRLYELVREGLEQSLLEASRNSFGPRNLNTADLAGLSLISLQLDSLVQLLEAATAADTETFERQEAFLQRHRQLSAKSLAKIRPPDPSQQRLVPLEEIFVHPSLEPAMADLRPLYVAAEDCLAHLDALSTGTERADSASATPWHRNLVILGDPARASPPLFATSSSRSAHCGRHRDYLEAEPL